MHKHYVFPDQTLDLIEIVDYPGPESIPILDGGVREKHHDCVVHRGRRNTINNRMERARQRRLPGKVAVHDLPGLRQQSA